MSTYATPPPIVAGGNILPSTFVMLSTVADKTALQATADAPLLGVSQVGTHDAPGLSGSSANAAIAGQALQLFVNGDICQVTVGATAVVRGDLLKSDASGNAVTGNPAVDNIGARALESGASGALILCQVLTLMAQPVVPLQVVTASTTLTIANAAGYTQANAAGSLIITLPPVASVNIYDRFDVTTLQVPASGVGTLIAINSADTGTVTMYGTAITTAAAGKGLVNTQGTSKIGDTASVMFDGTNWIAFARTGTWTRQA
jgi:hypothetical protein